MKNRLIRKIAKLMKKNEIEEVEVKKFFGLYKIRLRRSPEQPARQKKKEMQKQEFITINSPSVGTFYLMDPRKIEGKLFISMNQRIEPDQTLGLLEALKQFVPIKSEISGTVVEILVQNKNPVEYGQLLFRVKPD